MNLRKLIRETLEEQLNKPFGGKMNFTSTSFNWLIENAINKSDGYVRPKKKSTFKISRIQG